MLLLAGPGSLWSVNWSLSFYVEAIWNVMCFQQGRYQGYVLYNIFANSKRNIRCYLAIFYSYL
jgi:hypothetical protein